MNLVCLDFYLSKSSWSVDPSVDISTSIFSESGSYSIIGTNILWVIRFFFFLISGAIPMHSLKTFEFMK